MPPQSTLVRCTFRALACVATLGGVLIGMFTAVGVVEWAWGPEVVHTALGTPPDRSHPAFWAWLLIMAPAMVLTSAGTFVCVTAPLLRLGGVTLRGGDRRCIRAYALWLLATARRRAPGRSKPSAAERSEGRAQRRRG